MTMTSKIMACAKSIFAIAATIVALSCASPAALAQGAQDQQATTATAPQQQAPTVAPDVRNTLSQYGRFVQHQKYGEVWVPTVTPQGWHPYPPCNWVNSKQYGWYYDDKTPWGQIVHHYGRWVYDAQMGWIWTPGSEFSPGWVVWRTSPEWVGWAPMLPEQDVQQISASDFNNAGYWIFVETKKFAQGCTGTIAPAAQVPVLLKQTTYVTDIRYVGGIVVIVLPSYVVGPIVIIDINVGPWPLWFVQQILFNWNFVWNNLVVVNVNVAVNCAPKQIKPAQLNNDPKPQPINDPQRPPVKPEGGNPPIIVVDPAPKCPIGTVFNDGACRKLPDPCRPGMVRIGGQCIGQLPDPKPHTCPAGMVFDDGACRQTGRPDPKPPVVVNNDPCAKLSGSEFRRCIIGTPNDSKSPGKGPVTGGGDVRPVGPVGPIGPIVKLPPKGTVGDVRPNGNPSSLGTGSTGHVGGTTGPVNPVRPNVIVRPQFDGPKNVIRDNGTSFKPTTSIQTMPKQGFVQQQRQTFVR